MRLANVRNLFLKYDWVLVAAVLLLFCLGLAALYSINLSQETLKFVTFKKQLMFGCLGFTLMFLISAVNYSAFRVYSRILYFITLGLLIAVLFFGSTIRGTTGWFAIGGYGFQPVELAKIALIVFLSRFFSNRFAQFSQAKHIIVSLVGTLVFVGLVLLQPDFGSALVLLGVWFLLLLLTKVKFKFILVLLVILAVVSLISWQFVFQDYQRERLVTLLNPERDPLGSGYNVTQSIIAIGSGQIFGRGLGFGSQSQLKFIPESQTDFVFAVIAEELGLLGVTLILVLFGIVFWRLIRAAKTASDDFGQLILLGIAFVFFIHLVINVGMNLGISPVTGISLPFLSSGGSFLITSFILIGMAQSVIARCKLHG